MTVHELHDPDQVQLFLQQGLWLQRAVPPTAATVRPALEWALELAAAGESLLPVGFLADVGHVALGLDREPHPHAEMPAVPGLSAGLARAYEDHVLGKLYVDASFERAADALRRYQGRDRARGLAFLLQQFRHRAGTGSAHINPALIKALLERPPEAILAQGWETLHRPGLLPLLPELYEALIVAVRGLAEVLGPEDVFELEHGTALAQFSQRLALRQVLQAAAHFEAGLPQRRPRSIARRHEVLTRIRDEDTYPVGGFASISTRGSMESLLYSQLAFMEPDDRPDLFDIKFVRDELLYYSRDDNQFLRRRRTFVFALHPDLARARFKDAELPWQRIVLLLALLLVAVRKLTEWLSSDALVFEFLFLESKKAEPLAAEQALVEMLLREQIANGAVTVARLSVAQLGPRCAAHARRSLCHLLTVATPRQRLEAEATVVSHLLLNDPRPALELEGEWKDDTEAEDALAAWSSVLSELLRAWV